MALAKKSDSQIQTEVIRELKWDTRVEETDVGVEVDAGIVTLTGTVSSYAKRMAAQEAAHRVAGVLDVANDVKVHIPGAKRTDAQIAGAVRHALEWDAFVPDTEIQSTVSEGWVTLEGRVRYWSESQDAERAVRNLRDVRGVVNRIELNPPSVSTGDIRGHIEDALERQASREASRIQLRVQGGHVTVSGPVHSWAERRAVVGAIRGTAGVKDVSDDLSVDPYV